MNNGLFDDQSELMKTLNALASYSRETRWPPDASPA